MKAHASSRHVARKYQKYKINASRYSFSNICGMGGQKVLSLLKTNDSGAFPVVHFKKHYIMGKTVSPKE